MSVYQDDSVIGDWGLGRSHIVDAQHRIGDGFGLLAFILNFIPNVGSIIATLLPVPIILVQPEISLLIILAIGLPDRFR